MKKYEKYSLIFDLENNLVGYFHDHIRNQRIKIHTN